MPARWAMSMTLTERQGVDDSSSTAASSSRWRVARPRWPGTRPSVVAPCVGALSRRDAPTAPNVAAGPGLRRSQLEIPPGYRVAVQQAISRPLTRAQQARRQRVLDAAMALGLEGGYEAVQMRDVAARADVAMGTVYRYFASKDHLLASCLVYWVEQLEARLAQQPATGARAADRVLDALDRALRAMARQPRLVGAVFMSLSSPDPGAVACRRQITIVMERIVTRAVGESSPPDLANRARMIGHVWYSALVGWISGWSPMSRVHDELRVAVGLLLGDGRDGDGRDGDGRDGPAASNAAEGESRAS